MAHLFLVEIGSLWFLNHIQLRQQDGVLTKMERNIFGLKESDGLLTLTMVVGMNCYLF